MPSGFWHGSDIYSHPMSGYDASTIKPFTFTAIFTGSVGQFTFTDDTPPLYDGMHQSRLHGLSFSQGLQKSMKLIFGVFYIFQQISAEWFIWFYISVVIRLIYIMV